MVSAVARQKILNIKITGCRLFDDIMSVTAQFGFLQNMMLFDIDRLANFTVTPVPRFWFMLLQGAICSQARKNLLPKRVVNSPIEKFDISANAHVTRMRVARVHVRGCTPPRVRKWMGHRGLNSQQRHLAPHSEVI